MMLMKISETGSREEEFRAMGTTVSVTLPAIGSDPGKGDKLTHAIKEIFRRNEKIFSRFDPQSELSGLNDNLGQERKISEKMSAVLKLVGDYHRRFPKCFDPRILASLEAAGYDRDFKSLDLDLSGIGAEDPGPILRRFDEDIRLDAVRRIVMLEKRIDLAGIVKGWTVDEAAQHLLDKGHNNFIVEAGGDMFVAGQESPGKSWTIDIEGVGERIVLLLKDEGIATSGISRRKWRRGQERCHHLIDPGSPRNFSYDLKSVTVIADSATEADVLAKVIFLLGRLEGLKLAAESGIKCLILDYKNQIYVSPKIKENLV